MIEQIRAVAGSDQAADDSRVNIARELNREILMESYRCACDLDLLGGGAFGGKVVWSRLSRNTLRSSGVLRSKSIIFLK